MRGIWHRPWAKRCYHLFAVDETAGHPKGFLVVRPVCTKVRRRGQVKFFDVLEDPAPPAKTFPNCTACVKAYKRLRAQPAPAGESR